MSDFNKIDIILQTITKTTDIASIDIYDELVELASNEEPYIRAYLEKAVMGFTGEGALVALSGLRKKDHDPNAVFQVDNKVAGVLFRRDAYTNDLIGVLVQVVPDMYALRASIRIGPDKKTKTITVTFRRLYGKARQDLITKDYIASIGSSVMDEIMELKKTVDGKKPLFKPYKEFDQSSIKVKEVTIDGVVHKIPYSEVVNEAGKFKRYH